MNIEHTISNLGTKPMRSRKGGGFSLVELLVVIAIIGILAALIVGAARYVAEQNKIKRVQAELAKWCSMIDSYHDKLGYYPPSNPDYAGTNVLYYELTGVKIVGTKYSTLVKGDGNNPGPGERIETSLVASLFGVPNLNNVARETGEARSFASKLNAGDVIQVDVGGTPVLLPKVPVDGMIAGVRTKTNTWYYNAVNPVHNPNGYDLWAVYVLGSTLRTNGNWKD